MAHTPICTIAFTTPIDERTALANQAIALYNAGQQDELLDFVQGCLTQQPKQSDVVRDLLAYLAEAMLHLHQQRKEAIEDFLLGLESVLSESDLEKIARLWTSPTTSRENTNETEQKHTEAQQRLGTLAT